MDRPTFQRLWSGCRRRRELSAILFLILSGACTGTGNEDESAGPARVDSAGIVVVTNEGAERFLDWRFERILDLGDVDSGPAAFFRVFSTSIGVDSADNLYVLDAGNYRVSVFDRSGLHVRSYGRQGGGPGEFDFPSDMAVSSAGVAAVYDFGRRALVFFDAEGSYTGMFPLAGTLARKVRLLDDGTIVAAVTQTAATADSVDVRVLSFASDTVELASVRRIDRSPSQQSACGPLARPPYFSPSVVWSTGGNRVALSDGVAYSVRVYEGTRLTAIWRRDLPLMPATLELAAWEVNEGDSLREFGCVIPPEEAAEKIGYADSVPIIQNVVVSPRGGVWLRRRTAVPGERHIDVLDATGAYVGTLPPGSPFPALFRGPDEIVTVETDELDVLHVRVYRVQRGP